MLSKWSRKRMLWTIVITALVTVVLVTDNLREFRRVPGLQCENWLRG